MATTITLAALDSQGAAQISGGITHPGMTAHWNGAHPGVWIDPYNPVEFYYSSGTGIFSYHITNDVTTTHIANTGFQPDVIVRSFTDSKLYTFNYNSLQIYEVTDPTTPVLLSLTPTILIRTLAISADGTTFYYTGNDTRLFALDIATGVSTVLYTHGSVLGNNTYVLAADSKDGNTLYFTDANSDLYSYDIALDTTTLILATNAPQNAFCLQALDGVCYIGTWSKTGFGISRMLADGTGFDAYTPSLLNKVNMLDTVNKQIIQFDFSHKTRIFDVPSLGDWPVPPPPLTVTPTAITVNVVLEDTGAIAYRLTFTPDGGSEVTSVDSTTELTHNINNLLPTTNYTISLYTDTGSGFVFVDSVATTTLANSAANYAAGGADFADGSGGFDLTDLNDDSLALFSSVMDSLFTTGDDLAITLSGITRETTYAKVGGTLVVDKADTEPIVSIGFSGAALQTSTIDLTDDADVTTSYGVDYDPITDPVKASYTINGVTYVAGDSFILNGKKVTLAEF